MLKDTAFKFLYATGLTRLLRSRKKDKLTVLNLHRVTPEKDSFFRPLPPFQFEALLQYVAKHYHVVTFSEFFSLSEKEEKKNKPFLVLSFDDGYYDFMEYALPLLVKYKLPSNHNIVNICADNNEIIWTHRMNNIISCAMEKGLDRSWELENYFKESLATNNNNWTQLYFSVFKALLRVPYAERVQWIGLNEKELDTAVRCRMMNWDEINDCIRHAVEIGSHTYHHDSLSSITDYSILLDEIKRSKLEIENKIKKTVDILALPNGETNTSIEKACSESGISSILLVDEKITPLNKLQHKGIKLVSRINIIEEKPVEMYLRTEMFHSKFRKYV